MSDLQCWCDWCRGRAGVHGEEARALYRRQCEAASGRIRVPGSADYSVLVCVPEQAEPVRYASGGVIGHRYMPAHIPGLDEPACQRCAEPDPGPHICPAAPVEAASDDEAPTDAGWRWSICTDCGMWDLVTGLRDPLCAYCGELRSLPAKRDRGRLLKFATLLYLIAAAIVSIDVRSLAWIAPMTLIAAALALVCNWGRP